MSRQLRHDVVQNKAQNKDRGGGGPLNRALIGNLRHELRHDFAYASAGYLASHDRKRGDSTLRHAWRALRPIVITPLGQPER